MPKTPRYPEFPKNLAQRMRDLGYWQPDKGRPDVMGFIRAHAGYISSLFYFWLKGRLPDVEDLDRLARDLGVTKGWLFFGDEVTPGATTERRLRAK